MAMLQTIQRTFQRKSSNVKHETYCNSSRLNIYYPIKPDARAVLKNVQVSCMNRIFSGVGFRNDNGGLEFISDDFKEKHSVSTEEFINDLRNKQSVLEEEFEFLQQEISRGNDAIDKWQSDYEDLQSQLQDVQDSMQHLIMQGKSGLLSEEEKSRIRQQLKTENKRISGQMEALKKEIDGYYNNKTRFSFLSVALPELELKIKDKEKALAIANTFTIEQPGLLTFPWVKGIVAKSVCLFADMFDYLAYVYLSNNPDAKQLPCLCDNIVMNDPRNFMAMMLNSDSYDHVYCFFPHTYLGETIEQTILRRNDSRVVIMSDYYEGYTTLYEYAMTFEDFIPITSKV